LAGNIGQIDLKQYQSEQNWKSHYANLPLATVCHLYSVNTVSENSVSCFLLHVLLAVCCSYIS